MPGLLPGCDGQWPGEEDWVLSGMETGKNWIFQYGSSPCTILLRILQ